MKINIGVVTGTRAEFGQMLPLLEKMKMDSDIELSLIVTGMHLSYEHGETINEVISGPIEVSSIVDMKQYGDLPSDICNGIATGLKEFSSLFSSCCFDGILVMGDRYELLAVCIAAMTHQIPIIHVHGGEVTQGAMDDSIRHAITKMASIHFPSIEEYRRRIIQMGEPPQSVFAVGALAIDGIQKISLMDVEELTQSTGVNFKKNIALVTYHPVTRDNYLSCREQMRHVLESFIPLDMNVLITMPNSDPGYQGIVEVINEYVRKVPDRFFFIKNLGQRRYLSAMKHATIMVGNTSSGILESASFRIPVINVGDRQTGRIKPSNVIDCVCTTEEIIRAIELGLSVRFQKRIEFLDNPYGDGNAAERIIKILKGIDFSNKSSLLKKNFYNLV